MKTVGDTCRIRFLARLARAGLLILIIGGAPVICWGQSDSSRADAVRMRLSSLLQTGSGPKATLAPTPAPAEPKAEQPAAKPKATPAPTPAEPKAVSAPSPIPAEPRAELAPVSDVPANPEPAPKAPTLPASPKTQTPPPAFKVPAGPTLAPKAPVSLPPASKTSEYVEAPPAGMAPPPGFDDEELALPPAATAPCLRPNRCGFRCVDPQSDGKLGWHGDYMIPWEVFAQGEYVGPHRTPHVPEYRLRVDDLLDFVYIFSFKATPQPYRFHVRDRFLVVSTTSPQTVEQEVFVQPDGTISLHLLGQVRAVGLTLEELRANLDGAYRPYIQKPAISVTPLELNSHLQELRAAVDRRYGAAGGQGSQVRVTPAGTIQLPIIGSVFVQGLTLPELKREIEERYLKVTEGVEITPILVARAPRFFYIVGEVRAPGRYVMEAPTTVMQAIAQAGSWNVGAHLKHVVVFRRDENWCLMATKLDLYGALQGHRPCPCDEIWIRDSDLIIVPKNPILVTDDFIELVFTRGIYGVFPVSTTLNFSKLSTL